jgi:5,10-methylenetetrahydrofolate reductase
MDFKKKLKSGKFLVTSEIGPPKGTEIAKALAEAELIRAKVDAINVTDQQSSVMRLGSLAVCALLRQKGFEPIFQLTCRDRNRLALQSDILSAAVLGIENILALTGDHPSLGDHPQAKAVFDLDSVTLIEVIKKLESGYDMAGNRLEGLPRFCVGAVVNPGAQPLEPEIIKMEKKVAAGAEFFQTQAVFDIELFRKFIQQVRHLDVVVIAGIVLLKSAGMARYMNKNVAGVHVPDDLIEQMKDAKDKVSKSVEIAAGLIKELKGICRGVHIMPIGWDDKVPRVLEAAGL